MQSTSRKFNPQQVSRDVKRKSNNKTPGGVTLKGSELNNMNVVHVYKKQLTAEMKSEFQAHIHVDGKPSGKHIKLVKKEDIDTRRK